MAQKTSGPDEVPEELVLALFGDIDQTGKKEGDILVGEIPEWLPDNLILSDDAQVLGARVRGETQARVIVATAQPPKDIVAEYRRTLSHRGWEPTDSQRDSGFLSRRDAASARLCKGDASLSVSVQPPGSDPYLRLAYDTDLSEDHPCNAPPVEMKDYAPMPALVSPGDAVTIVDMISTGTSGFSDSGERVLRSRTTVESSLSASELAKRYGPQLRKEGWTFERKRESDSLAAWSWRLMDESGDRWNGLFTVITLPGSSEQRHLLRFEIRAE